MLTYLIPKTQKQIRQYFWGWLAIIIIISDFSVIAKSLYDLVRKYVNNVFGEKEQNVFNFLSKALTESPVLAID